MALGYMGYFAYKSGATYYPVPVTGSSVNLSLTPIYSNAVWGAGWYNAASTIQYADAGIKYEGGIDFELQMGVGGSVWTFLKEWAIDQRANPKSVKISPDGRTVYTYEGVFTDYPKKGMYCGSLSFSTSGEAAVTCSANGTAVHRDLAIAGNSYIDNREGQIIDALGGCTTIANIGVLNPGGASMNPVPFWRTKAYFIDATSGGFLPLAKKPMDPDPIPGGAAETTEWSAEVNNNLIVLYTCNGDRRARAILMGAIDVSANVTLYSDSGVYDPIFGDGSGAYDLDNPYLYAETCGFAVEIQDPALDPTRRLIVLPAVVVESDDFGIKGQSDVTTRAFTCKGLGGKCDAGTLYAPLNMMEGPGV